MKRLICESCGSNNIIRNGEYFVCQNCGTKYINDRADTEVRAVLDLSALSDNALKNARRAKSNQDWEEAERYYNTVEEYSPDNAEAVFYSAYARTVRALKTDVNSAFDALKVFAKDIVYIDRTFVLTDYEAQVRLLEHMSKDIRILCKSKSSYDENIIAQFKAIHTAFYFMLDHIIGGMSSNQWLIRLYSMQVKHLEAMMKYDLTADEKADVLVKLAAVHFLWNRMDPTHGRYTPEKAPNFERVSSAQQDSETLYNNTSDDPLDVKTSCEILGTIAVLIVTILILGPVYPVIPVICLALGIKIYKSLTK